MRYVQLKDALHRPQRRSDEYQEIIRLLKGRSQRNAGYMDNNDVDHVGMARQLQQMRHTRGRQQSSVNAMSQNRSNPQPMCGFCKKRGHTESQCFAKRHRNLKCYACDKQGHIARRCPSRPNGQKANGNDPEE